MSRGRVRPLHVHRTCHSAVAVRAASGRHRRPRRKQAICSNGWLVCVFPRMMLIRPYPESACRKAACCACSEGCPQSTYPRVPNSRGMRMLRTRSGHPLVSRVEFARLWPPRTTALRRPPEERRETARERAEMGPLPRRKWSLPFVETPYILRVMQVARAKLFQNGGSQAVRLPRECRFPEGQREVTVRREGARVILEPVDVWPEDFRKCLGGWSEEVPRPRQAPLSKLRDPFA